MFPVPHPPKRFVYVLVAPKPHSSGSRPAGQLLLSPPGYVAEPPLYSVEVAGQKTYVADEAARQRIVEENANRQLSFARFKGLGEMDYPELRETCMQPSTRSLVQITVDAAEVCDHILSVLMGDDVEHRRQWIQHNAKDVRFLDI